MKRSLWTARPLLAVGAAGVLLVAGCSSSDSGGSTTSAVSSSAPSSSAASSAVESSGASSEAVTSGLSESSGSSASGSVAPAELDEQTIAWFTTLCTGVAPIGQLSNPSSSGENPAAVQKAGVDVLNQVGTVLSETSEKLASAEPPTFEGGEQFASQITTGLADARPKLAALAKTFGAINPSDTAALQLASTSLATQLQTAVAPLQALGELPPDVSAAAQEIPACKALNG